MFDIQSKFRIDAYQTWEHVLKYIKISKLNFAVTVFPFSAPINTKKPFIKNKNGSTRTSGIETVQEGFYNRQELSNQKPFANEVPISTSTSTESSYSIFHTHLKDYF